MKSTNNESLSGFMKSNINSKSIAENSKQTANLSIKKKDKFGEEIEQDEESAEEKELKNAKKDSNYKASQYGKFEMYKKLVINAIIGYVAVLTSAFLLVIAVVKLGPAIITFFNILLYQFVMSSLAI